MTPAQLQQDVPSSSRQQRHMGRETVHAEEPTHDLEAGERCQSKDGSVACGDSARQNHQGVAAVWYYHSDVVVLERNIHCKKIDVVDTFFGNTRRTTRITRVYYDIFVYSYVFV